jgi:3-oxoacyl-[acyl-carrier protein] reductase
MIPNLPDSGIRLEIVSGDLIKDTITPKLLERQSRGSIQKRREAVGSLPSVEEFAATVVQARDRYSSGDHLRWKHGVGLSLHIASKKDSMS